MKIHHQHIVFPQYVRVDLVRDIRGRLALLLKLERRMLGIILRRLCSKEEPWIVIFVSNDLSFMAYVDRRIILE